MLYRETGTAMGTVVEITVADASERKARYAIGKAMAELRRIDASMSRHSPTSDVSRINREGALRKVQVKKEVFDVIHDSVAISEASSGSFDVTVLPLVDLWGFDRERVVPNSGLIAEVLPKVGYKNLVLDQKTGSVGFAVPGMGIDLGAIAKGLAVDRAVEKIVASGVRDAIVDVGGDVRVIGARPGKNSWRIGVLHPRRSGTLLVSFDLRDTAVATSGDYERFFIADGVRYHHILDPAAGQPARGCQSVTVLAHTAAEADACATAAFVLGPEKGLAFLRARRGVRGLIVDAEGVLHWTDPAMAKTAHL